MDSPTTTSSTLAPLHGSASSSPTDFFPPDTSTSEASRTSSRPTCARTRNVTSSPGLEAGPSRWLLPDGRLIDPCGLARALANLSPRQVRELGLRTSGISGRPGSISSRSADLQQSLESRLRERLSGRGSTLYKLTWKAWATPSGVCRYRLRASAPQRSATACSGWPRPTAMDSVRHPAFEFATANITLNHAVVLSGWPRTRASDGAKNVRTEAGSMREIARKGSPQDLNMASVLAGWPRPTARDYKSASGSAEFLGKRAARTKGKPLSEEVFVQLSRNPEPARLTALGELLTGCSAGMDSGGQLNPAHSRWLMGYPPARRDSAVTAMQSFRKSRQSSSARSSTPSEVRAGE